MAEDRLEHDDEGNNDLFEKVVRAGKRTYFFDVRATRNNDFYLTITESKRKYNEDGSHFYQKHKIFLYKEDFEKFGQALTETFQKIIELKKEQSENVVENLEKKITDIKFEDLGNEEKS